MRLYGLIGKNLDHSWSKDYFNTKFEKESLADCRYEKFPMTDLSGFLQFARGLKTLRGLNVTIPFKKDILPLLDTFDTVVQETGSVNVIKIERKGDIILLKGYNTDALAFMESLRPLLQPHHDQALVFGTGGAAASVCFALRRCGVTPTMVSRQPRPGVLGYHELDSSTIVQFPLIVNTTPVGMYPKAGTFPDLPYEALTSGHLLYDLVYNPEVTVFLEKGKAAGARVKNGLEMLHRQADLSWHIWNDQTL